MSKKGPPKEEINANTILKQFFLETVMTPDALEIQGNDWLLTPDNFPTAMLYANGRFQGLFPGLSLREGLGGHPGLVYRLIMCALCYEIPCVGISISGTVDDVKNPLTYEEKIPILQDIVQQIIGASVENIMEFVARKGYPTIPSGLEELIHDKLTRIDVEFRRLQNPFATVLGFKEQFEEKGNHIDTLIMASGLEASKTKGEYNKYEHTFDKLVGTEEEQPFRSIHFILTSRETKDTISGTKIRELILGRHYEQLAKYLLEAGFTTDQLIRDFGTLILSVKNGLKAQASQEEEEYQETLQDWMSSHAFENLEELQHLREKADLNEEEMERLSELETREQFLLDFTGQAGEPDAGGKPKNKKTKSRKGRKTRKGGKSSKKTRRNKKKSRKQFK